MSAPFGVVCAMRLLLIILKERAHEWERRVFVFLFREDLVFVLHKHTVLVVQKIINGHFTNSDLNPTKHRLQKVFFRTRTAIRL